MAGSLISDSILRKLPKVDLHCHLDGAVRTSTILELSQKQKIKLKADNVEKLKNFVQVDPHCRSLTEFLSCFENFYEILKCPDALERIAFELCEDVSKENVQYVEVRYAPHLLASKKMSTTDSVRAVIRGLIEGKKKFGTSWGIVLCMYRSLSQEMAIETVCLADTFRTEGVVALDLAGDESKYPIAMYADAYVLAKSKRIPITTHAGEGAGSESIREAITLGATRIGHGIKVLEDQKLYQEVIERQIPFEVCVTSNLQTQTVHHLQDHPFPNFFRDGLVVTLNTDDRAVSGIDLTHEYALINKEFGFSFDDCVKVVLNGVDALFLDTVQKKRLREKFEKEISVLRGAV